MFKQTLLSVVAAVSVVVAPVVVADAPTAVDPAISGWINDALSRNPQIAALRAGVDAAGGYLRAANQPLFNPALEFDYENTDANLATGGFSQTIDWSDKRGARTTVAEYEQLAASAELRLGRQRLAADLLRLLADWHTATAVVRVSGKQTALMARFARIAQQRRQAGDLGQVELDLAHLAAADAAFKQADANQQLSRARQALIAITGNDRRHWPQLPAKLPQIDPRAQDVEQVLTALPAMQVAVAQVAAGRARVQLRRREKKPDPTIGFRVGKDGSESLVGVTVSVPLFVRNSFSAQVAAANAELAQLEYQAAALAQNTRADLGAATQVYRSARLAWDSWEASGAPRLSQRTDLLERLWQAGELNTTEYLVQLTQSLDTEVGAIEQRGRVWRAWAAWLIISGSAEQWLNLAGDSK